MTEPRLRSAVMVAALRRRAESEGGAAAILASGDADAGAILVLLAEKGRKQRILERSLTLHGRYAWRDISSQEIENEAQTDSLVARRRERDPDLWIIELDVASAERFAAEMNLTL